VCAALWHLAVNDEFVLGGMLRGAISTLTLGMVGGAVGSTQLRPDALKCVIVVFFLVMNVLQVCLVLHASVSGSFYRDCGY
jgi:hypothetical protein